VEQLSTVKHLDTAALQAGLGDVRESPPDHGTVEMIVRRPAVDERELLAVGALDADAGLVGDTWQVRGSSRLSRPPSPRPTKRRRPRVVPRRVQHRRTN